MRFKVVLEHLSQRSAGVWCDAEPHDVINLVPMALPQTRIAQDMNDREVLLSRRVCVCVCVCLCECVSVCVCVKFAKLVNKLQYQSKRLQVLESHSDKEFHSQ